MTTLDLDRLIAVDVYVHVGQDNHGRFALDQELLDASAKYFTSDESSSTCRAGRRDTSRRSSSTRPAVDPSLL